MRKRPLPIGIAVLGLAATVDRKTSEVWDSWIVGGPSFGKKVRSVLRVAVAASSDRASSRFRF
jgi:hypothetical protein